MKKYAMGIDPGVSGSVCVVGLDGIGLDYCKNNETPADFCDFIEKYADGVVLCTIEKVHSSPQMGVKSSFTFGDNFGFLRGVLTYAQIPHEYVSPTKWMSIMKCRTGGDKNVTKRKAQELFPNVHVIHANADAIVIAEYTRRIAISRGQGKQGGEEDE